MSRRKKKRRQPSAVAKFAVGQRVRVRRGVTSPEYPDIPLGGWAGVIIGRLGGQPPRCGVRWSEETLANVHPVYQRRCRRDDLIAEETELPEEVLEQDAGGPLSIEQPTNLVTPPLSPDSEDDRIRAIFGLSSDDPLPDVDLQSHRKYHEYLAAHLPFPFEAESEKGFSGHVSKVVVTGLKEELPHDGLGSIVCDARENDLSVECALADLLAEDDQIHELIDDYGYWLYNFGGGDAADDEWDSGEADEEEASEEDEEDYPVTRASPPVPQTKAGRNDPCPCGSGRKYKKCCWNEDREEPRGGLPEAKSYDQLLRGAISETFQHPRRREVRAVPADTAYQIKITLNHTDPPIWRRVQLPDCTLDTLHDVIQIAMGWGDDHLHAFSVEDVTYGDSRMTEDPFSRVRHESSMTLSRLSEQGHRKLRYDYDFGDSWEHEIEIEETLPEGTRPEHPVCTAGEKACPPEDCGGVWGYYEIVEGLKNPGDPRFADRLEWAGDFDPEAFDPAKVNRRLERL